MQPTRRDVVRAIGYAGGAGAMYGAMSALGMQSAAAAPPFTPLRGSQGRGTSVVVLGGGIAGLTTAYELLKGGYTVTVLEARTRPGGRNWTSRNGTVETDLKGNTQKATWSKGEYMNMGPGRIPGHHVTLDYCRELGVLIEPFTNQNADSYLWRPGTPVADRRVKHREARADTYGYVAELLAKATNQGALDSSLTTDDKEALITFLRGFGDLGADYTYQGSSRRGYSEEPGAGLQAGVQTTPFSLHETIASGIGSYFNFELGWDQAMMMFQPVGGMDRIAYAFADAIGPGVITYGAEVKGYRNSADGVEVDYSVGARTPRTIRADYAVVALPPHLAARIPNNLPTEIVTALGAVNVTDTGKIGLEYGNRWWENELNMYGGITNSTTDVSNMWFPSHHFHAPQGVVVGYYNTGARARAYGQLRPGARTAKAIAEGSEIFGPVYAKDVRSSFSVYWTDVKYTEGGWTYWKDGQAPGTPYATLLAPTGRIHFAGDHLSHAIAWQHGAMTSARAAVEAIHTRVTA